MFTTNGWLGILAVLATGLASAEPVSINRNTGQGFVITYRNNCYVILPSHVHEAGPSLTLATGAPAVTGQARVIQTFMPGTDLSVAFVTGGLEGRCTASFAALPRNVDTLISEEGAVTLITVSQAGVIERLPALVRSLGYEDMTIEIEPSVTANVFKGRSGGVVLAGNTPVGMLIQAKPDGRKGRVLRMDTIVERVQRLLTAGKTRAAEATTAGPSSGADVGEGVHGIAGIAERIAACSSEGIAPDQSCWSLEAGSGPMLAPPGDLPLVITVELVGDEARPVSRIRLTADAESEAWTVPQAVIAEYGSGTAARPSWHQFGAGDMTPFGELELVNGMAPRSRTIRLTIERSWTDGLPVRLDGIEIR
jgi:hypothetical protein